MLTWERADLLIDTDPIALRDEAMATINALRQQRDQAVRKARKLADGIGLDWVDDDVLSTEWALAVPHA